MGWLISCIVVAANTAEREGAKWLLARTTHDQSRVTTIYADEGYSGEELENWVKQNCGWKLEVIYKPANQIGFEVHRKRWVVERSFAWLFKKRRLSKSYEYLPKSEEAMMHISMILLVLNRLVK